MAMLTAPVHVGAELAPATPKWGPQDAIVYALGVGARPPAELDLLYEERGPTVLPTFALIANWWAVKDLGSLMETGGRPIVHAFQSLEMTRAMGPRGEL